MLWAAPLVAVLSIPAAAILNIDAPAEPQQLAYLFGMALLGTWTALIPGKVIETRPLDGISRRLVSLACGLLVGLAATAMAHSTRLGLNVQHAFFFSPPKNLEPVYFGALYTLAVGWLSLAARDRKARFRFGPIVWTAFLSTALLPLWPYDRQIGIAIAVLIATVVQLVSPWNRAAALYVRYVRAAEKQQRKGKAIAT
jgi:hypothetical protein